MNAAEEEQADARLRLTADRAGMPDEKEIESARAHLEADGTLTNRERDILRIYGKERTAEQKQAAVVASDERVSPSSRDELAGWWRTEAESEIDMVVDKAIEYGSTDLEDIGHQIARIAGRTVSDTEATEIGIYFYIEGKVARFRSAVMEGRPVSADTLRDIGVYVRMASRNQQTGGWPGTKEGLE